MNTVTAKQIQEEVLSSQQALLVEANTILEQAAGMPDYCERLRKMGLPKKKHEMAFRPHTNKPDIDNCAKAFLDCWDRDAHVHTLKVKKVWAEEGCIIVY